MRICKICIGEGRGLRAALIGPTDAHLVAHLKRAHDIDTVGASGPPQQCPECGARQVPIAVAPGSLSGPDAGSLDVMTCGACGTFLVLAEAGWRAMTLEEVATLPDEVRIILQRMRRIAEETRERFK